MNKNSNALPTKSVFASIVGRPNVGKSSLLNAIIGEKVAIVSSKPQTTRNRITGILTKDETQFVFLDTPGLHKAKNKLGEHMVKASRSSSGDVDVAILMVGAKFKFTEIEEDLIEGFKANKLPAILVINKTDMVKSNRPRLLTTIDTFKDKYNFESIILTSVTKGEGIDDVVAAVKKFATNGPHYFPPDSYTDQPERVIVSEIIREKILHNLYEEIPHGTAVGIESLKELSKKIQIHATIYCEKKSHKGMIIGKQGQKLKKIGSEARVDIERFLGTKVDLRLWVKIKEDWRNTQFVINDLGLSSDK